MEVPFKYIVLFIIKTLNDRKMPLSINKVTLVDYFTLYMKKSFYTMEEKHEMGQNFNFEYEWDDFVNKYCQYFDVQGDEITFDSDYINELDNLIEEQIRELGTLYVHDINFVLNDGIAFLDVLGVEMKEDLYEFLLDIERELESCYNEMCDLETFVGKSEVNIDELITEMKKINIQKIVMLVNTKNLLSHIQYRDLVLYASNMADDEVDIDDLELLVEDDQFGEADITQDVFLRSVFTGSDLHIFNLRDSLIINYSEIANNSKYSKIKFYLTFLDLLEREIKESNEVLNIELIRIKYRIMNVLDSVYGTALFIDKKEGYKEFKEDYFFIYDAVYYFINELLKYDDEKYKNIECDTDNTMVYLNSIIKKLLIETYYKLTGDKKVIDKIKNNELYGVNSISSGFLRNIVDKSKTKVKEI